MFDTKKRPHYLVIAAASFALAACQANGGGAGAGAVAGSGGSGGGSIAVDDGIDDDGNIEGNGDSSNTGFPNDPLGAGGADVTGNISTMTGTDENGDPVDEQIAYGDSGKRFLCTNGLNLGPSASSVTGGGLVGGIVSPIVDGIGGGPVTALTNSVKDLANATDVDLTTASVFTLPASLLDIIPIGGTVDNVAQHISLPAAQGGYAVAAVSFPSGTLDLSLLSAVEVATFLDASDAQSETPTEPPISFPLTSIDLLGQTVFSDGYAFVGRQVTKPYNRVSVTLKGDGISVNVGEGMFLHEVCTAGVLVDVPAAAQ